MARLPPEIDSIPPHVFLTTSRRPLASAGAMRFTATDIAPLFVLLFIFASLSLIDFAVGHRVSSLCYISCSLIHKRTGISESSRCSNDSKKSRLLSAMKSMPSICEWERERFEGGGMRRRATQPLRWLPISRKRIPDLAFARDFAQCQRRRSHP